MDRLRHTMYLRQQVPRIKHLQEKREKKKIFELKFMSFWHATYIFSSVILWFHASANSNGSPNKYERTESDIIIQVITTKSLDSVSKMHLGHKSVVRNQ